MRPATDLDDAGIDDGLNRLSSFSERLLQWYRQHGRHDLPWQKNKSLYRTWVSEIMLQQTQVATVKPYYERFMLRFPGISSLAAASQDEVLQHWAGLGYYSRARNLHKAAQLVAVLYQCKFPETYEEVAALPGIGPSTAGAILAQVLGQRHAILDGNVKRVLARHRAIEGWPGQTQVSRQLWSWAETYTPAQDLADYTQAIMDLGATVCRRSSPSCECCPVQQDCSAFAQSRVAELPARKPRKSLPVRAKRLLIIRNELGHYLMEKRPPAGIWGGLWSLPELSMAQAVDEAVRHNWQLTVSGYQDRRMFRHTFSHFHLEITPCQVSVEHGISGIAENGCYQWHADISQLALAAPVSAILKMENNPCN